MTDAPFWSENAYLDLQAYRFGQREALKRSVECAAKNQWDASKKHAERARWYLDRAIQLEQQLAGEDEE